MDPRLGWEKVTGSGHAHGGRFRIRVSPSMMGASALEGSSKDWMPSNWRCV